MTPLRAGVAVAGCHFLLTWLCFVLALLGLGPLSSPVPKWLSGAGVLAVKALFVPLGYAGSAYGLFGPNSVFWGFTTVGGPRLARPGETATRIQRRSPLTD